MEWWLPGIRGRGDGELIFNGDRLSVWDEEKVLEVDGGNNGITL